MTDTSADQVREPGSCIYLLRTGDQQTAPNHQFSDYPDFKWQGSRHVEPEDLTAKPVLNIGCNAGFSCHRDNTTRGGAQAMAIGNDPHRLAHVTFTADQAQMAINVQHRDVYQMAELSRRFDLVIFMEAFYHPRQPLPALDLLPRHVVGNQLLFQSMPRASPEITSVLPDCPLCKKGGFSTHPTGQSCISSNKAMPISRRTGTPRRGL